MIKKRKVKISTHMHLWDIPRRYFPRTTKAKDYCTDLLRITESLRFTNQRVQYGAEICSFNIKSINREGGFVPSPPDVFKYIEEFTYDYENFCHRLYACREKLLQFLNAVLPIGYEEREVKIKHILINPVIKQAKLLSLVQKFSHNGTLDKVIKDRHSLTHKLYYGKEFDQFMRPIREIKKGDKAAFKKWCDDWKKEIVDRALLTNTCLKVVSDINNSIAERIVNYKEALK